METKQWYQSKTLWFNALTIAAGALSFLASPDAKLDAQTAGTMATVLGAINMALRFVTTQPVNK